MPIPSVYTATEDPTSQVGNNGDIYFHTGLIGISAINVYKKVAGRWGLTGSISNNSGAFLSANISRVDPIGSDSTGTVGNLSKPFLTVQGAINAIQAGSFTSPIVDIGNNIFTEDVTTSLSELQFVGSGQPNQPFNSITSTGSGTVALYFSNINACGDASPSILASTSGSFEMYLVSSYIHNVTNSSGSILGFGFASSGIDGIISAPGKSITLHGFNPISRIDSAGSSVTLYNSKLALLTAASSITLIDASIAVNNAGITPMHADVLLNPAGMDFSTLPTSQPSEVGKAWIDTTGGFNIVKVKL